MDRVVRVEVIWKRYCRTLRNKTIYILKDSLRAMVSRSNGPAELRPDEFWSLRDVSFGLVAGESLALCGRNGAGKTTLLRLLAGVIVPDRGELRISGRIASLMMIGAGFHPLLSGRENVYVYGSLLGLRKPDLDERLPAIVEFAEIPDFIDMPVKFYSSGMYMRLAFAIAAHVDPQVFLIDEVLAVGDAGFRQKCFDHLLQLKSRGTTLIIASHSPDQLGRLTDRALWLDRGKVLEDGPVEEVLANYHADVERHPARPLIPAEPSEEPG